MYRHKQGMSLKKVHIGDLHALLDLKNESWWGTHGTSIINIDDQRNWYNSLNHHNLAMMVCSENTPVGVSLFLNIDWYARTLDLSGSIFKDHRKPDIIKPSFACVLDFCFEILNMHRVSAEVIETHLTAQKLEIGYLGFNVEGRRRKSVYKSGKYYDSILLGILRDEWENSDRVKKFLESDTGCCNDVFDHVQAERCKHLSQEYLREIASQEVSPSLADKI
jgi:RimJ/RimL family protein N-acetyltransferase